MIREFCIVRSDSGGGDQGPEAARRAVRPKRYPNLLPRWEKGAETSDQFANGGSLTVASRRSEKSPREQAIRRLFVLVSLVIVGGPIEPIQGTAQVRQPTYERYS